MAVSAPVDATKTPAWEALKAHYDEIGRASCRERV